MEEFQVLANGYQRSLESLGKIANENTPVALQDLQNLASSLFIQHQASRIKSLNLFHLGGEGFTGAAIPRLRNQLDLHKRSQPFHFTGAQLSRQIREAIRRPACRGKFERIFYSQPLLSRKRKPGKRRIAASDC